MVIDSVDSSDSFHFHVTKHGVEDQFELNWDLSNVAYVFDSVVCGFEGVDSTDTPSRSGFCN